MTNPFVDMNRERFPKIAQLYEDSLAILLEYPNVSLARVINIFSDALQAVQQGNQIGYRDVAKWIAEYEAAIRIP